MPTKDELIEEEYKIKRLRFVIDLTINIIMQGNLSLKDAFKMVESVKGFTLKLFPDKEEAFELIYRPRFKRLLIEKYDLN